MLRNAVKFNNVVRWSVPAMYYSNGLTLSYPDIN